MDPPLRHFGRPLTHSHHSRSHSSDSSLTLTSALILHPHLTPIPITSITFAIMVTPRRSARVAASDSSPVYTDPPESGIVRKRKSDAGSSPSAKRGKKSSKKSAPKQQTIDDAMDM